MADDRELSRDYLWWPIDVDSVADARRRDAGRRLLDAADMPVPEPHVLRTELDALRARRA